jgi:CRISPR system Cascade subunit CasD
MTERPSLLLLRLEGVLQSWGENAKWDFRGSAAMPSKSGIVGLLSCAMGWERDDPRIADLSRNIRVAVRSDRPGTRFIDFQTVTGRPLLNAEGKSRTGGNTFTSERCYLQDASFLVVIETDAQRREQIVSALKNPRWCLYLGRKSCVPSLPILEDPDPDYQDWLDAIKRHPLALRGRYPVSYECEVPTEGAISYTRPDERQEGYRAFHYRRVWHGVVTGEKTCILQK